MNTPEIKAVVIDDESNAVSRMKILLKEYCAEITVVGEANSVEEGINVIDRTQPDLVFLDIMFPVGTGFDVLKDREDASYAVIFVTSYNHYAVKAFDFSALHYLVKPVDPQQLVLAVNRFKTERSQLSPTKSLSALISNLKTPEQPRILVIPDRQRINVVNVSEIVYCCSEGTYTDIFLMDGQKFTSSRHLMKYEMLLGDAAISGNGNFMRVHQTWLINLYLIKRLDNNGYLTMNAPLNTHIPVSRKRMKNLKDWLKKKGGG